MRDEVYVNSLSSTKIYVNNLDIPEVKEYTDRFGTLMIQPEIIYKEKNKKQLGQGLLLNCCMV